MGLNLALVQSFIALNFKKMRQNQTHSPLDGKKAAP